MMSPTASKSSATDPLAADQVTFGSPELSAQASLPDKELLAGVVQVHDALCGLLDRPLRVIDLSCGRDGISLCLGELGALITEIEVLDAHVLLCQARQHPQLQSSHGASGVEDPYDLVLGLDVWGPLVDGQGWYAVQELLTQAAVHSGALLVALTTDEAPGQPPDLRSLLAATAFVHEIIPSAPRSLFAVSNRYWILDGQAAPFDTWSEDPHLLAAGTHQGSRRYYFNSTSVVKLYRFDHSRGTYNWEEFTRERELLANPPPGFSTPACLLSGAHGSEGWSVVECLPGRLLLDLLREGVAVDHRALLLALLGQLVILEAAGLYHGDVRTWNILVTDQGRGTLIDYGSITPRKEDVAWPGDLFLSFFILVREVATGLVDDPSPLRTIAISPLSLPQPYRRWAQGLWQLPLADWSFGRMHTSLLSLAADPDEVSPLPLEVWMKAVEEAVQAQKLHVRQAQHQLEAGIEQARREAREALASALAAAEAESSAALHRVEARLAQTEAESSAALHRVEARLAQTEAESQRSLYEVQELARRAIEINEAVYASHSWRVTVPLRLVSGGLRHLALAAADQAKRAARRLLGLSLPLIRKHPSLTAFCRSVLGRLPRLEAHLCCFVAHRPTAPLVMPDCSAYPDPQGVALTPAARRVYRDLKVAGRALAAKEES